MNTNVYATSTLQTKQSGQIEGKIVWNNQWKKFQVSVDGEPTGEFKNKEDAVEELKNNGFKNIKINNQFIQENKIPTKRQIKIVENFIKNETRRLMKEATDEELIDNMKITIKNLESKLKTAKNSKERELIKKNISVNIGLINFWKTRSQM